MPSYAALYILKSLETAIDSQRPRSQICTLTSRKPWKLSFWLVPGGRRTNTGEISLNKATVFKKCVSVVCVSTKHDKYPLQEVRLMDATTMPWSQNSEWWLRTVGSRVRELL